MVTEIPLRKVDILAYNEQYQAALVSPGRIQFVSRDDDLKTAIGLENAVIATYTPSLKISNTEREEASISILPTRSCNLGCNYCYAGSLIGGETLKIEEIQTGINYIRNLFPNATKLVISLSGGGEPLLPFRLVQEIGKYAASLFPEVGWSITTNGTWSKRVADWLLENDTTVTITFDGVKHDEQRPFSSGKSSASVILGNIKYLIDNGIIPNINMVISKKTYPYMRESLNLLGSMGIISVKAEPVGAVDQSISRSTQEMTPQVHEFADAFIDSACAVANGLCGSILYFYTSSFTIPDMRNYCGVTGDNFILAPGGWISSCVEVSNPSDSLWADKAIYGKVNDSNVTLFENVYENLTLFNERAPACNKCDLLYICGGGCPMETVRSTKNFPVLSQAKYTCDLSHYLIPRLLAKMCDNPKLIEVIVAGGESRKEY